MARRVLLLLLGLLVLVALPLALWRLGPGRPGPAVVTAVADSAAVGVRAATLFFSDASGQRWLTESRELVDQEGLHAQVAALLEALAAGPRQGGVATVPAGTRLQQVYRSVPGELVLDVSRAFLDGLSGGSRTEDMAVGSIVRTLAANVEDVRQVRIVCQGPLVSAGGHLPLDRPLDPQDWP